MISKITKKVKEGEKRRNEGGREERREGRKKGRKTLELFTLEGILRNSIDYFEPLLSSGQES